MTTRAVQAYHETASYLLARANKLEDRYNLWNGSSLLDIQDAQAIAREAFAGRTECLEAYAVLTGGNYADATIAASQARG